MSSMDWTVPSGQSLQMLILHIGTGIIRFAAHIIGGGAKILLVDHLDRLENSFQREHDDSFQEVRQLVVEQIVFLAQEV